jgi:hypothetical protein
MVVSTIAAVIGVVGLVYALVLAFGALGVKDSGHVVTIQPVQPTLGQPLVSTADASAETTAEPMVSATTKPTSTPTSSPTSTPAPTSKAGAPTRTTSARPKPSTTPASSSVPVADPSVDLALNRPVTVTSHTQNYVPSNVTDSDQSTYWQSAGGFPQTLTVDLGSVTTVGRLDLALPPCCLWLGRTQTIEISGSSDGLNFHQIRAPAGYSFSDLTASNSLSVAVPAGPARFVRLTFTANTAASSAQLSRLQIYSS